MKLNIVNTSNNPMPAYETKNSAGMDLRAYLPEGPITLEPMQRGLVPTGLYMEIPEGYEGQVRPRSGLALKSGITVLNSPHQSLRQGVCHQQRRPHRSDGHCQMRTGRARTGGDAFGNRARCRRFRSHWKKLIKNKTNE